LVTIGSILRRSPAIGNGTHAFAVMSLTAGEHYMAVSKMLGHASYVTTLTVYADYITEGDGGKAAPLRRPVPSSVTKVVPMRRPG
jgi:integrase